MCGRYRRKSDKQRIADAFAVTAGLEELDLRSEEDIAPGSMQPVVSLIRMANAKSNSCVGDSSCPDRLLFNARSEGIDTAKFWKDAFLERRSSSLPIASSSGSGGQRAKQAQVRDRHPRPGAVRHGRCLEAMEESEDRSVGAHVCRPHREPNEFLPPIHDRMTTL